MGFRVRMNPEREARLAAQLLATLTSALEQCSADVVTNGRQFGNPLNHPPFKTLVRVLERLLSMESQAELIGAELGALELDDERARIFGVVFGGDYTQSGLPQLLPPAPARARLLGPLGARLAVMGTPHAHTAAARIARITGQELPELRRKRASGVPRELPTSLDAAIAFARDRDVLEALGEIHEARQVAPGVPEVLAPLYARLTAIAGVLAPAEDLPRLRARFDQLAQDHLAEAPARRGKPRSADLHSYLPLERCTPFGVAQDGDLFFVSARARDPESRELAVLRLAHDEAGKVRPWARTLGEHVALAALAAWGDRALRAEEVTKRIWGRRVSVEILEP
jgi:hypothetical protein